MMWSIILLSIALATSVPYSQLNQSQPIILQALQDDGYVLVCGVPEYQEIRDQHVFSTFAFARENDKSAYTQIDKSNTLGWNRGIETYTGKRSAVFQGPFRAASELAALINEVGREVLSLLPIPQFPVKNSAHSYNYMASSNGSQSLVGSHRDHGVLAGIAGSVYLDPWTGQRVSEPLTVGLHVRGKKVIIPDDCMAFKLGEMAQILSNGQLSAAEYHEVNDGRLDRITMSVFFHPADGQVISSSCQAFSDRYRNGMTYGEWNRISLDSFKQ